MAGQCCRANAFLFFFVIDGQEKVHSDTSLWSVCAALFWHLWSPSRVAPVQNPPVLCRTFLCCVETFRADILAIFSDMEATQSVLTFEHADARLIVLTLYVYAATSRHHRKGAMPDGTFGREYQRHMDDLGITADSRKPVRFVDDEELAFVAQRYRETHDFVHCLVNLGISEEEEMVIKWFEAEQTGLPMCYLGGTVGPIRLPAELRGQLYKTYIPWARRAGRSAAFLMNVYFENRMDTPLVELRAELNIELPPPGLRDLSR